MSQQSIEDLLNTYPYDITELDLSGLGLHYIPSLRRFYKLQKLNISKNNLSDLPMIPDSVLYLDCSENNIREIFSISDNTNEFRCNNNLITNIYNIPNTLNVLQCQNNYLRALPPLLQITQLFCENNELWHIPKPNVLEYISCKNNSENISEYVERSHIMERLNEKILDVEGNKQTATIYY